MTDLDFKITFGNVYSSTNTLCSYYVTSLSLMSSLLLPICRYNGLCAINLGYCSHTSLQTRGPQCTKRVFSSSLKLTWARGSVDFSDWNVTSVYLTICPSVRQYVINFSHFQLHLHNYHKCSSRGPEEVLCLFEVIKNTGWLPWPLIDRDSFNFSRTTACEVTRLTTNPPLVVLKKCCFFSKWCNIQHGHPIFWLTETFGLFSQNYFNEVTSLSEMFL
jgi:hypothetical protein